MLILTAGPPDMMTDLALAFTSVGGIEEYSGIALNVPVAVKGSSIQERV